MLSETPVPPKYTTKCPLRSPSPPLFHSHPEDFSPYHPFLNPFARSPASISSASTAPSLWAPCPHPCLPLPLPILIPPSGRSPPCVGWSGTSPLSYPQPSTPLQLPVPPQNLALPTFSHLTLSDSLTLVEVAPIQSPPSNPIAPTICVP